MSRRTRAVLVVALAAILAVPVVAVAADRFTDVPNTHPFHDDISWLASAGVTLGCNPPTNNQFCPDDLVKRQQMAAFMRRFAQYLGAEDGVVSMADNAATADDADMLDGMDSTHYETVVAGAQENWLDDFLTKLVSGTDGTELVQLAFEMPTDGYAAVTGTATLRLFPTGTSAVSAIWVQIDNDVCEDAGPYPTAHLAGTLAYAEFDVDVSIHSAAGTGALALTAGSHTATLCAANESASETGDVFDAGLTVVGSSIGSATVTDAGVAGVPPSDSLGTK